MCVASDPTADEVQEDKQEDQDEGDDPKDFHSAWRPGGQFTVGPHADVVISVAVRVLVWEPFSHMRVLLWIAR